jgi:hypothetical protein
MIGSWYEGSAYFTAFVRPEILDLFCVSTAHLVCLFENMLRLLVSGFLLLSLVDQTVLGFSPSCSLPMGVKRCPSGAKLGLMASNSVPRREAISLLPPALLAILSNTISTPARAADATPTDPKVLAMLWKKNHTTQSRVHYGRLLLV